MPEDESFRRYVEAGMAWFSVTQHKSAAASKASKAPAGSPRAAASTEKA